NLQILLQGERLKLASGLPFLADIIGELQSFRVEIGARAHETFGPWRESEHDDLVLALAIAAFGAARFAPMRTEPVII
ncbi:MAG TPA: hypothetical protein VII92_06305, partial [Anaerolineae bacterium]